MAADGAAGANAPAPENEVLVPLMMDSNAARAPEPVIVEPKPATAALPATREPVPCVVYEDVPILVSDGPIDD